MKNILYILVSFSLLFSSCYSFTGASISPDTKTINIRQFSNVASLVNPRLSQLLTDAVRDKYTSQTSLNIIKENADLLLSGSISDYSIKPMAIQGNETAALNRLTVTINVNFQNRKNEKQSFDTNFSRYKDYQSNLNFASVEDQLLKEIIDELVDDIFNKSVVNW